MKKCLFLIYLVAAFASSAAAQDLPVAKPGQQGFAPERLASIDTILQSFIDDGHLGGAVGLVARHGKVVYYKSFGMRDISAGDPMEPDDIFRIASMTKPITCTAVMILYEEGQFLLTDPVSKYIPEFKNPTVLIPTPPGYASDRPFYTVPASREITIRHLLNHTSGISYGGGLHTDIYKEHNIITRFRQKHGTIGEMVKRLRPLPLLHNPGEQFTYSLSDDVLGYLVEVLSGMPMDRFCEERIFKPLRMKDTYFFVPPDKINRLASLYATEHGKVNPATNQVPEEPRTFFSGGGGLRSTAGDYARFAQMILNGGELDGVRIISRKTVELMTVNSIGDLYSAFRITSGDKYGYGFGIRTERGEYDELESLGILGWDGAYLTRFWIDPKEELVGIFMTQMQSSEGWVKNSFRRMVYQAITD